MSRLKFQFLQALLVVKFTAKIKRDKNNGLRKEKVGDPTTTVSFRLIMYDTQRLRQTAPVNSLVLL